MYRYIVYIGRYAVYAIYYSYKLLCSVYESSRLCPGEICQAHRLIKLRDDDK